MAVYTFTYGSETWIIQQQQKLETAEMKFLKSVAGYTRKDQIRNTKIREEMSIINLNSKILSIKVTAWSKA
jgi:glutathionylspermidine synthase